MDQEPDDKRDTNGAEWIGVGLAIGAGIGVAIGTAIDNIALGVAFGPAIGMLIGVVIMSARNTGEAADRSPDDAE